MRFVIIERNDALSQAGKEKIYQAFIKADLIYDEVNPELVISIGGDGTLLEAFNLYKEKVADCHFVGIHSGSLGFYTDWLIAEIDEFIAAVLKMEMTTETYPLLNTKISYSNHQEEFLALNEVTLTDYHRTLALNVYIDEIFFESFRGTGFCIATPSGSTAYNKSLGGALIHPSIQTFQLTEMASINNKVYRTVGSPLVFSKGETVRLEFTDFKDSVVFTNDQLTNDSVFEKGMPQEICFKIAPERIQFARYRAFDFWQRVKRSFLD